MYTHTHTYTHIHILLRGAIENSIEINGKD